MKVIKYYAVSQFGNHREFVHSDNKDEGKIIQQLTGQKTINSTVRELIQDLTGGLVKFELVQEKP